MNQQKRMKKMNLQRVRKRHQKMLMARRWTRKKVRKLRRVLQRRKSHRRPARSPAHHLLRRMTNPRMTRIESQRSHLAVTTMIKNVKLVLRAVARVLHVGVVEHPVSLNLLAFIAT